MHILPLLLPLLPFASPQPPPPFQIATAPNPSPTSPSSSPLVSLVSRLPQCLIPCYALVAQRPPLACDPSDLECVCRRSSASNNLATLSLGIADCLMVGLQAGGEGLFAGNATGTGADEEEDKDGVEILGCALEDMDDLAELAGEICGMVGAGGVGRGEMEEAAGVIRGMMARAGVSGGLPAGEGLGVSGGGRGIGPGVGALVVVVGYGVVFL
ncbi:hypothetical protein QBC39DRAFT_372349 [Podospora conica]|nr:hypothetical protein QBC39DRAFT_372349 [Schizothecium conicum]